MFSDKDTFLFVWLKGSLKGQAKEPLKLYERIPIRMTKVPAWLCLLNVNFKHFTQNSADYQLDWQIYKNFIGR